MKKVNDFETYLAAKSDEELVSIIAEEYANSELSMDELIEAGMDGIAKAHDLYDNKNHDFSFNAYAVWWIRQRILQAINSSPDEQK